MIDLPDSIDPRDLSTYMGPKYGPSISVQPTTTVTSFGEGTIPIEPPIHLPTGGIVVMGDSQSDSVFHALAVYVDGQRTALYRLADGRFIRDGETS